MKRRALALCLLSASCRAGSPAPPMASGDGRDAAPTVSSSSSAHAPDSAAATPCHPGALAALSDRTVALAVGRDAVFGVSVDARAFHLFRVLKAGGAARALGDFVGELGGLVVVGETAYVARQAPRRRGSARDLVGAIVAVAPDGSARELAIGLADPDGLAADAENLYWGETQRGGIFAVGQQGGGVRQVLAERPQLGGARWHLFADGASLVGSRGSLLRVRAHPGDGGASSVEIARPDRLSALAAHDATHLYFTAIRSEGSGDAFDGGYVGLSAYELWRIGKDGQGAERIEGNLAEMGAVAADARGVYWGTHSVTGEIEVRALDGSGRARTIASGVWQRVQTVATDGGCVYFTVGNGMLPDGAFTLRQAPADAG